MSELSSIAPENGERIEQTMVPEQWTYTKYKEVAMRCGLLCGHPPDDAVISKVRLYVGEVLGWAREADQRQIDDRPGQHG